MDFFLLVVPPNCCTKMLMLPPMDTELTAFDVDDEEAVMKLERDAPAPVPRPPPALGLRYIDCSMKAVKDIVRNRLAMDQVGMTPARLKIKQEQEGFPVTPHPNRNVGAEERKEDGTLKPPKKPSKPRTPMMNVSDWRRPRPYHDAYSFKKGKQIEWISFV